jgi:hypothetical protein
MNPLDQDQPFQFTLANPNPTSSKTKEGPRYRVSFELTQDEWQAFMDTDTTGMILECQAVVTHRAMPSMGGATASDNEPAPPVGEWAKHAVQMCGDHQFRVFLYTFLQQKGWDMPPALPENEYQAGKMLKSYLSIRSRREIDDNEFVRAAYQSLIDAYRKSHAA